MVELKINDKPISEFKDVGELAKALRKQIEVKAKFFQQGILDADKSLSHIPSSPSSSEEHEFSRYTAQKKVYAHDLRIIDQLFETDYSNINKYLDKLDLNKKAGE